MEIPATGDRGFLIRKGLKFLATRLGKPFIRRYLSEARTYSFEGIRLEIPPGVFHPGIFFSTKLMIRHLKTIDVRDKALLELGAGSGLVALHTSRRGARVMTTDINPKALHFLRKNSIANHVCLDILHSDVFQDIEPQVFDIICVNPPYFMKAPASFDEYAWYAGEKGEFFEKFFSQVKQYSHPETRIYMVLSDACDLKLIRSIAARHNYQMLIDRKRVYLIEVNYIFSVVPAMKQILKSNSSE